MEYKEKYLIYKKKYLSLKKKQMIQTGGTIKEVFEYIDENQYKINPHVLRILQEYADSLITTNPNITVSEFILNVNTTYDIKLPPIKQRMTLEPMQRGLFGSNLFKKQTMLPKNSNTTQPTRITASEDLLSFNKPTSTSRPPAAIQSIKHRMTLEPMQRGLFGSNLFKKQTMLPKNSNTTQPIRITPSEDLLSFNEPTSTSRPPADIVDLIDLREPTPPVASFNRFQQFLDREYGEAIAMPKPYNSPVVKTPTNDDLPASTGSHTTIGYHLL
jgi:hypothetical protein